MTGPRSWGETPAGIVSGEVSRHSVMGSVVEEPFEAQRREFFSAEHQQAVGVFQAALDADPSWQWARQKQAELAERGWPGRFVDLGQILPAPLRALHLAARAAGVRQGVVSPDGEDETYRQMTAEADAKYQAAQARLAEMNAHLPPGYPR